MSPRIRRSVEPASRRTGRRVSNADYQSLLRFRTGLRRFLRWSEQLAAEAGLTSAQHQLMLAVRGHPDPRGPTVSDVAGYLLIRHHSAVESIDRAVASGLLERMPDPEDGRVVRLRLTQRGNHKLERLAALTKEELARLVPEVRILWEGLGEE